MPRQQSARWLRRGIQTKQEGPRSPSAQFLGRSRRHWTRRSDTEWWILVRGRHGWRRRGKWHSVQIDEVNPCTGKFNYEGTLRFPTAPFPKLNRSDSIGDGKRVIQ